MLAPKSCWRRQHVSAHGELLGSSPWQLSESCFLLSEKPFNNAHGHQAHTDCQVRISAPPHRGWFWPSQARTGFFILPSRVTSFSRLGWNLYPSPPPPPNERNWNRIFALREHGVVLQRLPYKNFFRSCSAWISVLKGYPDLKMRCQLQDMKKASSEGCALMRDFKNLSVLCGHRRR